MNDLLFLLRGSHKDWKMRLGMVQSSFKHVVSYFSYELYYLIH